jgi:signal transduction histidine kinase/FixJ family two-component response regulator
MTAAATALAAGDSELVIELDTKDETRTLADAFNRMLENTRLQVKLVESIAAGDMSITLEPRSEKDHMNRALEKLNATIKAQAAEIRSEHEQLEQALCDSRAANSAKSSFLAQMSHEIRTPLNAVVGLSELALGEDALGAELSDKLEKIHNSGVTILSIVNDILDISKIESGKFELYPAEYDTPSLVNDIVTLNIVRIGEKPITFKLELDESFPGRLFGDDLRVKQIFNNLLSNAFKYTNAGTVEWRLGFERDGPDIWIVSSVSDTGLGMKPESLAKLFDEYNQVDANTNRKVEGTGLGLTITKRLVEMMDGEIKVTSTYGEGSEFSVRLRQGSALSEAAGGAIGKAVAENLMNARYLLSKRNHGASQSRIDLSYAHVLVVDDIPTNLDVVKGMMKPYGMKIDCAVSGKQAIEMIKAESPRYAAVFMDHMMPEMDGIETTGIIRELGTDYARSVPIVALTANAIIGNEEMFMSRGFQAFLSKPIDMAKLDVVLRRWVRDKNQEISIAGIDAARALERFGGDRAVFLDVLRSYYTNTGGLLDKLEAFLKAESLADYAVTVHGVKGSSYGVLAQEAGALAESLEAAATAGDLAAVKRGHPAFSASVKALLGEIGRALALHGTEHAKPRAKRPDTNLISELREACAAFNMDSVDSAMEKLEAFQYESGGELVAWLREKVDEMAFEEIANGKEMPNE